VLYEKLHGASDLDNFFFGGGGGGPGGLLIGMGEKGVGKGGIDLKG